MPGFHPLERAVLPHLAVEGTVAELQEATGLDRVEVVRALQWLSNKGIVETETTSDTVVKRTDRGETCVEKGLPETRLLQQVQEEDVPLESIQSKELKASIGVLKQEELVKIQDGKLVYTDDGDLSRRKAFLQSLPQVVDEIEGLVDEFQERGLVDVKKRKTVRYRVTDRGEQYRGKQFDDASIERVTHELLKNKGWKGREFRAFDVEANVPLKDRGKPHFVEEAKDYIKQIWLELGFQQMTGDIVQSAFWNLDTLFVPQDHPARDMQDTFYVDADENLDFEAVYNRVKEVHERGGDTESEGWQYDYSEEEARRLMLRTHTTVLSAKTLAALEEDDVPRKYFSLGRNYRNESLDWKHLFEFYQVEGIVVDPEATFSNLVGYLQQFFTKMGFSDIRIRPGFFPYTEPSAEVDVYHPEKEEWVELGGAGLFRPEVTQPLLGFECPVLAWGIGLERIITDYYGIDDLRRIYGNDIEDLRTMKKFIR